MYSVILVDDEPFIINGLMKIINWEEYKLNIIGTASNGDELLKLFNATPVDIIITDIHLPDINGLKLIEHIKSINSDTKFIILSGYDDFEYVREGMKLGIENYLLKPINSQELVQTLKTTVGKIDRPLAIENFIKHDFNILRDNILYRWVTDTIDYQELLERSELLKINLDYEFYMISCVKVLFPNNEDIAGHTKEINKSISSLYSLCNRIINNNPAYMCFCDMDNNIVLIIGSNDEVMMRKQLHETLNNIIYKSKTEECSKPFVTVGDIQRFHSNIHISYKQALETQDYILISSENNITYFQKVAEISKNSSKRLISLDELSAILVSQNSDEVLKYIDGFFEKIKQYPNITPSDVRNCSLEILLMVIKHMEEVNTVFRTSTKDYSSMFASLLKIKTIDNLKKELKLHIENIVFESEVKKSKLSPIICQIVNYVHENYAQEICLKTLSRTFNINSAYLGQLFQRETGASLSEYVNNLRMEKSKELLISTNLKSTDIALAIGYYDSNYFYRKFKEHYKISPSEFRNSINHTPYIV